MTIVEFIEARLRDDEQDASNIHDRQADAWLAADLCACDHPARVLAEVAAKRRLVSYAKGKILAADRASQRGNFFGAVTDGAVGDKVLQLLALPYRDHEDYDPAWAPDA